MSKLLILLLFALVQNLKVDNIEVYDAEKMEKLMGNVVALNVKEGDEFYLRFHVNGSVLRFWKFINFNEIPDSLENFCKDGKAFKTEAIGMGRIPLIGAGANHYYKFKALKPSMNEIALKFQKNNGLNHENSLLVIKINILPKNETS